MKIQTVISIGKHKVKIPQKFPGKLIERRIMHYIKEIADEEGIPVEKELEKIWNISIMITPLSENQYVIYGVLWFDNDYIVMEPLIQFDEDYTDLEVWMEERWDAIVAKMKR